MRCGIFTQKERWKFISGNEVSVYTEKYLQPLYGIVAPGEYTLINSDIVPGGALLHTILQLKINECIRAENEVIACKIEIENTSVIEQLSDFKFSKTFEVNPVKRIYFPHHLLLYNEEMIRFDFSLLTGNKTSQPLHASVQTINPSNIFIEEGAQLSHCIINAETGPVYIGRNALLMEGCTLRGPFAAGERSVLKMGAKIYGATTIGPYSTGGGEIKNSIISCYSNKAHDGYFGDSYIGEWCNLGAGTTNSNVKNTGGIVGLYNYPSKKYIAAGNKCGAIIGDYSRTAINTSINTGTVIGLCCNVFGNGLTPKFIPDFSWGFNEWEMYHFDKAIQDIHNWKVMKNSTLSAAEKSVLEYLYKQTFPERTV